MKLFHRVTVSLTDEEMKVLEELRRVSGESLSQIFRDALYIYYRLVKASKKAGVDYRKYFNDIDRLAYHMYHVETGQFVILDREFYRVLLKKLQENVNPEDLENDEEFVSAVKGIAKLFLIEYGWDENTRAIEKAEIVLRMIEFAGGGTFVKVNENELIFQTPPENLIVTKIIIKTLFELLEIRTSFETTSERIFIRVKD